MGWSPHRMTAVSLRSRVRVVLQHLALVVLGFAVALVVAEGLLQAAAWYVRATGRSPQAIRLTGSERVVCVGDSNTYGLYLQRDQGDPAELQKQWNAHPDLPPIEVVNLGVPGTNSFQAARQLRAHSRDVLSQRRADHDRSQRRVDAPGAGRCDPGERRAATVEGVTRD